jgi:hypothetical protein
MNRHMILVLLLAALIVLTWAVLTTGGPTPLPAASPPSQEKCACGMCACGAECHGDACDCKACACKKCGCPR